jgi:hypothetical protein
MIGYLYMFLFLYAASSKLLDFETFTVQLAQSPLLSAYASIIAWLVPGTEIAIALLLMVPKYRTWALHAAFTLMVMFTAYIYIILNFSEFIPCSCGGVLEALSWTQHLVFNLAFILLAGVAIFIAGHWNKKMKGLLLFSLATIGVGIVATLFAFAEKKNYRNNAFERRYINEAIIYKGDYDLGTNNYYIAGFKDNTIYLGNYQAPLYLRILSISLDSIQDFPVHISDMDLPYRRVRIVVAPPFFYLGDGTVPVIFRGRINDWHATIYSYGEAHFKAFEISDSIHIGLTTISNVTSTTTLGLLEKSAMKERLIYNDEIITKQIDGIFDTDGEMLWNAQHKKWIYIYYYRNAYEVTHPNLQFDFSGKTIDTISKAVLDIAHNSQKDQYKKGGKSIVVNRSVATFGDYLYINSDRLGRNEDASSIDSAAIIDVYNIADSRYEFSFFLHHQPGGKLDEFRIDEDILIAIVNGRLWVYKLKPAYFNTGSNTTHTGQYQDEDRTPVKNSRSLIH